MFRIKTYLAEGSEGLGVFTGEAIKKGAIIWIFDWSLDIFVSKTYLSHLHPLMQEWFHKMGWKKGEVWYAACDNAGFIRHSDSLNLSTSPGVEPLVAVRDISVGEELTEDYTSYDELGFI